MKKLTSNSLRLVPALAGVALGLLSTPAARAAVTYWDPQGTAGANPYTGDLSGTWENASWSTGSGGTATPVHWVEGTAACFGVHTGIGTPAFTVTMNANHSFAGVFIGPLNPNSCDVNIIGSGILTLASGEQGFDLLNASDGSLALLRIGVPIAGSGIITMEANGQIFLNATNTLTGGLELGYSGATFTGIVNFNNGYAFGTGPIKMLNGNTSAMVLSGTTATTVTNSFTDSMAYSQLNLVGNPAGLTFSGPWSLGSGVLNLGSGGSGNLVTISGVISGTGSLIKGLNSGSTLKLAAANTYTGTTTVTNGTLEIAGSVAGNVVVTNTGVLKLDSATALKSSATLSLDQNLASGAVNLNFSGTNTILGLYLGGTLQSSGTYGAPGSTATYQFPYFTGSGVIAVAAAPTIIAEPQSVGVYPQTASRTFNVVVTGDQATMQYQWKYNGTSLNDGATVFGSQTATLTLYPPFNGGTYTCAINNVAGSTNTLPATLSILATNDYVNAVLQDNPIGYWRLDETSGSTAYDWVGNHHAAYINANLNQPGFSVVPGSDSAISVPKNTAQRGYVGYTNAAPDFSFLGNPFTLEAWVSSTNFGSNQRIISTAANAGGGYALSFPDNKTLEFTINFVADWPVTVPTMSAGTWYHCVVTFDGNTYTLYFNGTAVGTRDTSGGFVAGATQGLLCFGNDDPTFPVSEQVKGGLDEVAIYNSALSPDRVSAHYVARYSDAPLSVTTPTAAPATNYVSLSSTLSEAASGANLTYQWYHGSGTGSPVGSSSTSSTLTLGPLQLSDAGSYHCVVTDAGNHSQDTPMTYLSVVAIPTNAAALNLTNGLVLHLPFDSDYKDISGRNNNGTAVGATSFAANAAIGGGALHYGFQNGVATNYVTLGTPADLKFGTNSFTVSYWVRGTANTGLPFLCDSTNGLPGIIALKGGFYFGPDTSGSGGWQVGIGSAAHEMVTGGAGIINNGNWHHVVSVVNRAGNVTTYLDGNQVDAHPVSYVTDSIDSTWPVNIGQDGTGAFAPAADQSGDIDDVAVWNRTLSQFEVEGVYLTGVTYKQSFAPVVVSAPPLTATTISSITPTALSYTGGSGTHFVLLGTNNLAAPLNTWPRLLTNSATPGSFTLPVSGSSSMFYRVSSEN